MVIALTPALCEEILFRGIVLNSTRQWRTGSAILLNGVLFGAMHMSLANLPALSIMGAYMAFIVWRSGSIFQSCLVHFINNSLAVLMLHYSLEERVSEEQFLAFVHNANESFANQMGSRGLRKVIFRGNSTDTILKLCMQ